MRSCHRGSIRFRITILTTLPETLLESQTRVESPNFKSSSIFKMLQSSTSYNFDFLKSLISSIFGFLNFRLQFFDFPKIFDLFNFWLQFFDFLKSSGSWIRSPDGSEMSSLFSGACHRQWARIFFLVLLNVILHRSSQSNSWSGARPALPMGVAPEAMVGNL
jgi:hypothetical protein